MVETYDLHPFWWFKRMISILPPPPNHNKNKKCRSFFGLNLWATSILFFLVFLSFCFFSFHYYLCFALFLSLFLSFSSLFFFNFEAKEARERNKIKKDEKEKKQTGRKRKKEEKKEKKNKEGFLDLFVFGLALAKPLSPNQAKNTIKQGFRFHLFKDSVASLHAFRSELQGFGHFQSADTPLLMTALARGHGTSNFSSQTFLEATRLPDSFSKQTMRCWSRMLCARGPRNHYVNDSQGNKSCNWNCNLVVSKHFLCNCNWCIFYGKQRHMQKIVSVEKSSDVVVIVTRQEIICKGVFLCIFCFCWTSVLVLVVLKRSPRKLRWTRRTAFTSLHTRTNYTPSPSSVQIKSPSLDLCFKRRKPKNVLGIDGSGGTAGQWQFLSDPRS